MVGREAFHWVVRVLSCKMLGHRGDVDRGLQAQGTSERLAAHRQLEAVGSRVDPGSTPRQPVPWVGPQQDRAVLAR